MLFTTSTIFPTFDDVIKLENTDYVIGNISTFNFPTTHSFIVGESVTGSGAYSGASGVIYDVTATIAKVARISTLDFSTTIMTLSNGATTATYSSVTATHGVLNDALQRLFNRDAWLKENATMLDEDETVLGSWTFSATIGGNITGSSGSCRGNSTTATNATNATNADTVDGFHASQTPGANQIPVLDALGELVLTNGSGSLARLMPNGDLMAARSETNGVIFLSSDKVKFLQCLSGVFQFGSGSNAFQARHDANTYHGRVAANGTAIRLPTGWTSSKTATGTYRIIHNLGTANYTLIPGSNGGTANTGATSIGTYDFYIQTQSVPGSGVQIDAPFAFSVFLD